MAADLSHILGPNTCSKVVIHATLMHPALTILHWVFLMQGGAPLRQLEFGCPLLWRIKIPSFQPQLTIQEQVQGSSVSTSLMRCIINNHISASQATKDSRSAVTCDHDTTWKIPRHSLQESGVTTIVDSQPQIFDFRFSQRGSEFLDRASTSTSHPSSALAAPPFVQPKWHPHHPSSCPLSIRHSSCSLSPCLQ